MNNWKINRIKNGVEYLANFIEGIHSPVDIPSVKMEYEIYLIKSTDGDDKNKTLLVNNESYNSGIAVSAISWGIAGPLGMKDAEGINFSMTLHDISGSLLGVIGLLNTSQSHILFRGPRSDGKLWGEPFLRYQTLPKSATIEFSQTQGFTYTITGVPYFSKKATGQRTLTDALLAINEFSLNGAGLETGATFSDYIMKLFSEWQKQLITAINSDPNAPTKINLFLEFGGFYGECSSAIESMTPVSVSESRTAGADSSKKDEVQKGTKSDKPTDFKIPRGMHLYKAIEDLWMKNFTTSQLIESFNGKITLVPTLMGVYGGSEDPTILLVGIQVITGWDNLMAAPDDRKICIGPDSKCRNIPFRGHLTSISLNETVSLAAIYDGGGNSGSNSEPMRESKAATEGDAIGNTKTVNVKVRENPTGSGNPLGWGSFGKFLDNSQAIDFKLGIEMPYSFGMHPESMGGLLKDFGNPYMIDPNGLVSLEFYWYADVNCAEFVQNYVVSRNYQFVTAKHNIGLSGNKTEVHLVALSPKINTE